MTEVIGREYRAVKRELNQKKRKEHADRARGTHEAVKRERSMLKAFQDYAQPLIRVTLDPTYTKGEGLVVLSIEEARGLRDELRRRRQHTGTVVTKLKADEAYHVNAAANGYLYDVIECELHIDDSATQVRYVVPGTGEVVHQRKATGEERQMSMPDDEIPSEKGKKKKSRRSAPGAVQ